VLEGSLFLFSSHFIFLSDTSSLNVLRAALAEVVPNFGMEAATPFAVGLPEAGLSLSPIMLFLYLF